jgi:hypothetical protein
MLNSQVYVEQMALTTGVNEVFTRDEMRRNNYPQKLDQLRDTFLRYVLKIDAGRMVVPDNSLFEQVKTARRLIEQMLPRQRRTLDEGKAASGARVPVTKRTKPGRDARRS